MERKSKHKVEGKQIYVLEQVARDVTMKLHITEANDIVRTMRKKYCNPQEGADYGDLRISKPQITLSHILKKLNRHPLYSRTVDVIKLTKENFYGFMREISKQAEQLQTKQRLALE